MGKGSSGAVRVDDANGGSTLTYGRQFSAESGSLYSSITRETINALKAHFRDQVRVCVLFFLFFSCFWCILVLVVSDTRALARLHTYIIEVVTDVLPNFR